MKYYLSIDFGASSGRHILGYLKEGKLVLEEIYRFSNAPLKQDGHLVWDTKRLFTEIKNGLIKCAQMGINPESIAIDTWGVDYMLLDSDDKEIYPSYCYRDKRTAPYFNTPISNEELYSKTGIQFQAFNTIYQLLSDKAAGRLDGAKSMLFLPEYFSYLLSGVKAREYTIASTSGLVNAKTCEWDTDILDTLGLKRELFTPLCQPGAVLGKLSDAMQKETGLTSNVILPACHDTASAVIACPSDDALYISSGTWSLLGIECKPILTPIARENGYTNEGSILGKVRFLKNIMGMWMIQQVRHETGDKYEFSELAAMAEKEAVYDWALDVNDDSFLSPDNMTDAIMAKCIADGVPTPKTIGELAHCIYNSLAHYYKLSVEKLESITGKHFTTLNIIGGGSKNSYLNKLTAKYLGIDVYAGPTEATAIGNILVQMVAGGEIADYSRAKELIRNSFDINHVN